MKICISCGKEKEITENNICEECFTYYQEIEEEDNRYFTVTRDMALDAEDPSLEGTVWRW